METVMYIIIAVVLVFSFGMVALIRAAKTSPIVEDSLSNEELCVICSECIEDLKSVEPIDFVSLINIHKFALTQGIMPKSLTYSSTGKFRSTTIENLCADNIYFSTKTDSFSKSISEWMEYDLTTQKEVWLQYKNTLLGSIGSYKQELSSKFD